MKAKESNQAFSYALPGNLNRIFHPDHPFKGGREDDFDKQVVFPFFTLQMRLIDFCPLSQKGSQRLHVAFPELHLKHPQI
ncbi:MAG: hypothetical protein J7M20_09820 [Deltaproteobacteria bacterium]|nr:hypothetical protein [Deltaproteobacteria bacterium]